MLAIRLRSYIKTLCITTSLVFSGCQAPIADLSHTEGTVSRSAEGAASREAASGDSLLAEEWLLTRKDGRATVSFRDSDTLVQLNPDSVLVLPSKEHPLNLKAGKASISAAVVDVQVGEDKLIVKGTAVVNRVTGGRLEVEIDKGQVTVNEDGASRSLDIGRYIKDPGGSFTSPEPEIPEEDEEALVEDVTEEQLPPPEPFSIPESISETIPWNKVTSLQGPDSGISVNVQKPKNCGTKGTIVLLEGKKPRLKSNESIKVHLPVGTHTFGVRCRKGRSRMTLTVEGGT